MGETNTDLFSHHTMKHESHVVDAFREGDGPGVLGRMIDVLEKQGMAVGATAVNAGRAVIIDGDPSSGRLADVMSPNGVPRMFDRDFLRGESRQIESFLSSLHAETDDNSGIFANAFAQSFVDTWNSKCGLMALSSVIKLTSVNLYCVASLQFMNRNGLSGINTTTHQS